MEKDTDIEDRFVEIAPLSGFEEISIDGKTVYLKQSKDGSFIGVNPFFADDVNGLITLVHPTNEKRVLSIELKEALKIVAANRHYWLGELSKIIEF